jgi:hypothetical protein
MARPLHLCGASSSRQPLTNVVRECSQEVAEGPDMVGEPSEVVEECPERWGVCVTSHESGHM